MKVKPAFPGLYGLAYFWKIAAKKPCAKLKIKIHSREEFCAFAHTLLNGLEQEAAKKPFLIALNGTTSAGKSLMRDIAIHDFLGDPDNWKVYQRLGGERWFDVSNRNSIPVGFSNARLSWETYYIKEHILSFKTGIYMLANGYSQRFHKEDADISIQVSAFGLAGMKNWERDVVVEINNEKLISCPAFKKAIERLQSGEFRDFQMPPHGYRDAAEVKLDAMIASIRKQKQMIRP